MGDKHLSTQFDAELSGISNRVLEMGALVENQVASAVQAMAAGDVAAARGVLDREAEVDRLEVQVDAQLSAIIARRQPTARDLRFLIAVSKTITNLERAGDEASRIARAVQPVGGLIGSGRLEPAMGDLEFAAKLAISQLRKALDAFARLQAQAALEVLQQDGLIDAEFDGLMRKLITYMMEDPRTISASIELVFVAKAIERVGDHAKNVAEQVIYVVEGADVRYATTEAVEDLVRGRAPKASPNGAGTAP